MLLAQGRFWRVSQVRDREGDAIEISVLREAAVDELREFRDLEISVPLARWNRVVKNARVDRKLLGGVLLDFATHKDLVSAAIANEWLLGELQRVILDATVTAVEQGLLALAVVDVGTG